MRVFLDADVLFAASDVSRVTSRLVRRLVDEGTAVTCDYARAEAERNCDMKGPGLAVELAVVMMSVEMIPTVRFALPVEIDERDGPILCSAIRGRCDFLVTGDTAHFGHLFGRAVEGVKVVTLLGLAGMLVGMAARFGETPAEPGANGGIRAGEVLGGLWLGAPSGRPLRGVF